MMTHNDDIANKRNHHYYEARPGLFYRLTPHMHTSLWEHGTFDPITAAHNTVYMVEKQMNLKPGMRVMDAGCGIGNAAAMIARRNPGVEVVGVNFSPKQVALAEKMHRRKPGAERLAFVTADMTNTGLEAASFDCIYAIEALIYLPEKAKFITEALRLLKPGGRLVIDDYWLTRPLASAAEKAMLKRWCDNWSMASIDPYEPFCAMVEHLGFEKARLVDKTKPAMFSAFIWSAYGYILGWPLELFAPKTHLAGNTRGCRLMFRAFKRFIAYGALVADKPV